MEKSNTNKNMAVTVAKIIFNSLFYLVIVTLLIFSVTNLTAKDEFEVPSVFGSGYVTVLSDSMAGNEKDSFTKDDLLVVKKVTDKNRDKIVDQLEIGDIITFKYYAESAKAYILNTHRIVDIEVKGDSVIIYTQGDGNVVNRSDKVYDPSKRTESENTNDSNFYEVVNVSDIRAVYKSHINGFGKTMKYLQTSDGFMLCVLMPTAALFIVQAFILYNNFSKIRQQKMSEKNKTDFEAELAAERERIISEERERIRAEILAQEEVKKNENSQENEE